MEQEEYIEWGSLETTALRIYAESDARKRTYAVDSYWNMWHENLEPYSQLGEVALSIT